MFNKAATVRADNGLVTITNQGPDQTRAPYDLVWDSLDDNGFPLNPRWGKQDKYMFGTGSRDLWVPQARPRIYEDCLNMAELSMARGISPIMAK